MAKRKSTPKKRAAKKKPVDRTERALLAAIKQHRGSPLTQAESRDLTWWNKQQLQSAIDDLLPAIPKGVYCKLAGRQQKVIDEQAERYGLPISGATIDLFDAIAAFHDLIADNARHLIPTSVSAETDDDDSVVAVHELQVEKLRQELRKLKTGNDRLEIALRHDRGDTIDRRDLRDILTWLSTRLQGFGQQLRRSSGGIEAQKACNEFLEHLAQEVESGVLRV